MRTENEKIWYTDHMLSDTEEMWSEYQRYTIEMPQSNLTSHIQLG